MTMPLWRGRRKLELRPTRRDARLPDFPLLRPYLLVFPDKLLTLYEGWHEECYELIPCSVEGHGKWWLLNVCYCPPYLDETRSSVISRPEPGYWEIAKYALTTNQMYEPFFRIWQTCGRELLLDEGATPLFREWYAENKCTGLSFEPVPT